MRRYTNRCNVRSPIFDEIRHESEVSRRSHRESVILRGPLKIAPKGIVHLPTGATYTPHPGAPYVGTMNPSQLGNVLPNGEDYPPHEVKATMEQLWAEYVAANPRLFEVDD